MSKYPDLALPLVAVIVMGLASPLAVAQDAAQPSDREPALSWTADNADLEWGPCPPFMPETCAIAILHGDPAMDNADVFFKIPPGSNVPMHWHNSAERMMLVSGEMHVTYKGQATVVMLPGTYAYGPARAPHEASCAEKNDPCVLFIAFESPIDAIAGEPPGQ